MGVPGSQNFCLALALSINIYCFEISTLNSVLNGHLKIDVTKILMPNGSLMKVESIAECSFGAFCNTVDLHKAIIGLKSHFLVFF